MLSSIHERDAWVIITDMVQSCKHNLQRAADLSGCSFCIKEQNFIIKSQQKHQFIYDYSLVKYINSNTKVKIICKIHGVFEQLPYNHMNGQGCAKCSFIKNGKNHKLTHDQFVKKGNKIHNFKYEYVEEYKGTETLIQIKCPDHGIFMQSPHSHLSGRGCSGCVNDMLSNKYRKNLDSLILQYKDIHQDKYDYSQVSYLNNKIKIKIICYQHGEFWQKPIHHLQGHGCPQCSNGSNVSKLEIEWLNFLNIPKEYRQNKLKINNKIFKTDAFDPVTNTVYEFYGDYFHGNPKIFKPEEINIKLNKTMKELYDNTLLRESLIKLAGYNLITMWESDWKKPKSL